MDVDARRALEVIRRGSNDSIKEAINSLLGFNLGEKIQMVRDDIATDCREDYCRRGRRPGYGSNVCRTCDTLDSQRDRLDEIIQKLDSLEIVAPPTPEEDERALNLIQKIKEDNARWRAASQGE